VAVEEAMAKNRVHGGCNDAAILLKLMKNICARSEVEIRKDGHNAFLMMP
jgi:hypothetical protein